MKTHLCALTIAGSDSGGGAGIQADLKTFAAHGVHGLSAIAALTAQNTRKVSAVEVPSIKFLHAQIDACFGDFKIGAVKIGMLANARVIKAVAEALLRHKAKNIVLDPVMVASSGATLLEPSALKAMRELLIPLASVVTPNIPEAELLLGHKIKNADVADAATVELLAMGSRAVLLKGGHLPDKTMTDRYDDGELFAEFIHKKLKLEGHGTGCTLASAIAANLCLEKNLPQACADATDFVHGALVHAYKPGKGKVVVLNHLWQMHN
ncbi:MAG TPA: bifunctional hydroxymethylpyrimidine kinase/phosphomethylpyrimidine kinase [Arenimonas sp.]|nr:bifunctional hydroxymethylpyrimidine kinase/phosphomethylpyrimidine kinase [Arenimonas sp.]HPO23860.1 bifunctional hydroxymethylpyrimidine kinase/phosphomethylpyrimidine kinase [Arenimonas sp.]